MFKRLTSSLLSAALILATTPTLCFANNANEAIFYLGDCVDAGLDTGYNESNEVTGQNPHFGWILAMSKPSP